MKNFKNIIMFILIFTIVFGFNVPTYSKEISQIPIGTTSAKVLQVIDGDTIKVELPNKDIAYVKLKGIDAKGFDESYEYLTNTLLGQNISLSNDGGSYYGGKFNYLIVYFNGININNQMLESGYAVIDTSQNKGSTYNSFVNSQNYAKQNSAGMWRFEEQDYSSIMGSSGGNINYTDDKVNINTATRSQLEVLLKGVSKELAREIINYREKNPFSNIQEIKFVKGFTKKIYDQNKNALTVYTNINTANEFELKTLNDLSDDDIKKIIEKRSKKEFTSVSQIKNIISSYDYDRISDYISINNVDNIDVSKSSNKANISLSSKSYLTSADVTYSFADNIIEYRKNGYTYKTLMELSKLGTSNISEQDIHYLEDNLDIYTNLNTGNLYELTPVFSRTTAERILNRSFSDKKDLKDIITESEYNRVKDAIYVDKNKDEYVNINTATKEQMYANGIPTNETYHIIQSRPIRNAKQFPLDVTSINNKISLYTNINTASKTELLSLNNGMTDYLADSIIKYRKDDNFGSLEEIEEFFKVNKSVSVYNNIKDFIVVR